MKLVSGTYCIPCKMLHTWMKEQGITVDEALNSEKDQSVIAQLGVKQTPTLVLDDGTLVTGLDEIKEQLLKGENK